MPSLLVETIGQRGGGGLVDQAQHFEAGDASGVFRGLALRVVEVRGHGDDGFRDRRVEVALGIALELAQDEGGNLRRREDLSPELDAQHFAGRKVVGQAEREELQFVANVFDAAAHQALNGVDGPSAVRSDGLRAALPTMICALASIERHHRRHQVGAVLAGNDTGLFAFHEGDQRVGGAEIDTDDFVAVRHLC